MTPSSSDTAKTRPQSLHKPPHQTPPVHPSSKLYPSAYNYTTTRTTYYRYPTPSPPPPPPRTASCPPTATMPSLPSRPRQVSFGPIPATVSRLPRDDELYVMHRFARHASHCAACAHPYTVHKTGRTLCPKGHQRAIEVTEYVIAKEGKHHSVIDLEGNKRVEIEIPPDCGAVRELLKALERGLRLRRHEPIISYDETYHVPPRTKATPYYDNGDAYIIAPPGGRATTSTKHTERPRESRRRSPVSETVEPSSSSLRRTKSEREKGYRGRGSLYEADMKEKERRLRQQERRSTYYSVGDRGTRDFHY